MNERDHYRMQEDAEHADHIAACVAAILDSLYASTLSQAQRSIYKGTDCGASLGWRLDDGSVVWNGDGRERDPSMVARVVDIAVGSIVEGSDADVPHEWLNIPENAHTDTEPGFAEPKDAVAAFWKLAQVVDAEACRLWHEDNGEVIA